MFVRVVRMLTLTVAACLLFGCSRPKPPTVQVEQASVSQVSLAGLVLQLNLAVTNPNSIGFRVQSVKAKVRLDGRFDLGPVIVPHPIDLAPQKAVPVAVPLTLGWADLSALAVLARDNRDIDYDAEGSVAVGTDSVSFDVPVKWHGVLRKDDLVKAALRGLPGFLQGL